MLREVTEWELKTTKSVKEIDGTQIVEFIVKQPKDIISEWIAETNGELSWEGSIKKFKSKLSDDTVRSNQYSKIFTVP